MFSEFIKNAETFVKESRSFIYPKITKEVSEKHTSYTFKYPNAAKSKIVVGNDTPGKQTMVALLDMMLPKEEEVKVDPDLEASL